MQYCILKIQTDRIFKSMRKNNHVEVTISPEANDELFNYCLKGLPQGEGGRGIGNSVEKYLIKRGRCRFVPSATTPSALPAPSVQPRGEHVRGLGRRDARNGVRVTRNVSADAPWIIPTGHHGLRFVGKMPAAASLGRQLWRPSTTWTTRTQIMASLRRHAVQTMPRQYHSPVIENRYLTLVVNYVTMRQRIKEVGTA